MSAPVAPDPGLGAPALSLVDPARGLWRVIVSPVIAALHFTASYIATSVYCLRAGDDGLGPVTGWLAGATGLALLAIGLCCWTAWRRLHLIRRSEEDAAKRRREVEFLARITWYLALLSGVGVLFVAAPLIFIGHCA
jgi:hypothetical protein